MEPRPCTRCGHVRRVVIHVSVIDQKLWWRSRCTICELEDRAERHERAAQVFRARIADLRNRRAARGGKGGSDE